MTGKDQGSSALNKPGHDEQLGDDPQELGLVAVDDEVPVHAALPVFEQNRNKLDELRPFVKHKL